MAQLLPRLPGMTQFLSSWGLPQAVPRHSSLAGWMLAQLHGTVVDSEYKPYIHWISGWPWASANGTHTSYPTDLVYVLFHGHCHCILSFLFAYIAHPETRKQFFIIERERESTLCSEKWPTLQAPVQAQVIDNTSVPAKMCQSRCSLAR